MRKATKHGLMYLYVTCKMQNTKVEMSWKLGNLQNYILQIDILSTNPNDIVDDLVHTYRLPITTD